MQTAPSAAAVDHPEREEESDRQRARSKKQRDWGRGRRVIVLHFSVLNLGHKSFSWVNHRYERVWAEERTLTNVPEPYLSLQQLNLKGCINDFRLKHKLSLSSDFSSRSASCPPHKQAIKKMRLCRQPMLGDRTKNKGYHQPLKTPNNSIPTNHQKGVSVVGFCKLSGSWRRAASVWIRS